MQNLRGFLGELGLNLPGGDKPEPKDYLRLAETIEARPDQHIIQTMMLRSMQQAVYSPENKGHFGLAYEAMHILLHQFVATRIYWCIVIFVLQFIPASV